MIITTEDIRAIRPIAENVNDIKRLIPYIDECENLFLIPILGASLYKKLDEAALMTNSGIPIATNEVQLIYLAENIKEIFEGCYYENDTKYHNGLKKAMGYLVYSRFVRNQNINVTAFAVVTKQGQFSETVDEKTIVRTANDAEKIGLEYLRQAVDYINSNLPESEKKVFNPKSKFKIIGD